MTAPHTETLNLAKDPSHIGKGEYFIGERGDGVEMTAVGVTACIGVCIDDGKKRMVMHLDPTFDMADVMGFIWDHFPNERTTRFFMRGSLMEQAIPKLTTFRNQLAYPYTIQYRYDNISAIPTRGMLDMKLSDGGKVSLRGAFSYYDQKFNMPDFEEVYDFNTPPWTFRDVGKRDRPLHM